jgi:hypothetical protein
MIVCMQAVHVYGSPGGPHLAAAVQAVQVRGAQVVQQGSQLLLWGRRAQCVPCCSVTGLRLLRRRLLLLLLLLFRLLHLRPAVCSTAEVLLAGVLPCGQMHCTTVHNTRLEKRAWWALNAGLAIQATHGGHKFQQRWLATATVTSTAGAIMLMPRPAACPYP